MMFSGFDDENMLNCISLASRSIYHSHKTPRTETADQDDDVGNE